MDNDASPPFHPHWHSNHASTSITQSCGAVTVRDVELKEEK